MNQQNSSGGSERREIAVEKGATVYFRLDSGAIITIKHRGDSLELNTSFGGELVLTAGLVLKHLKVFNFTSTQELEQMLASGEFKGHTLTDEERQRVQENLDRRAEQWERIKGWADIP